MVSQQNVPRGAAAHEANANVADPNCPRKRPDAGRSWKAYLSCPSVLTAVATAETYARCACNRARRRVISSYTASRSRT